MSRAGIVRRGGCSGCGISNEQGGSRGDGDRCRRGGQRGGDGPEVRRGVKDSLLVRLQVFVSR
jgi:hypothetical protein